MKKFLAAIAAALAINAFAGVQVTKQYCDNNSERAVSNSYQLVKVEAAKLPGIASNVTASITPQIITNKVDEVMRSESVKTIITNTVHNTIMNESVVSNAVSAAAYDAAGRYTDQASDYAYIASTCAVASATSSREARIEAADAFNSKVQAGNSAQSAWTWAENSRSYSDSSHSAYNDIVVFTNWFEVNKGQVVTNVHVYYPGLETLVNTNWVADFYFVRKSDRNYAYQRMYFDGCCKGRNGNPAYIFKRRSTTPTMMADWGFGFNFRKAIVTPDENALKRGVVYPFIDAEVEKFNTDGSSLGVFKYSSSIQSDMSWPFGTFVFYEDDTFRLQTQRGPTGTYGSPNQTYRVEFATQDEIKEIDDLKSSIYGIKVYVDNALKDFTNMVSKIGGVYKYELSTGSSVLERITVNSLQYTEETYEGAAIYNYPFSVSIITLHQNSPWIKKIYKKKSDNKMYFYFVSGSNGTTLIYDSSSDPRIMTIGAGSRWMSNPFASYFDSFEPPRYIDIVTQDQLNSLSNWVERVFQKK